MESYGDYLKRMSGRAVIIAAIVVFCWVFWTFNSAEEIRKAAGVSYGNHAQLEQLAREANE